MTPQTQIRQRPDGVKGLLQLWLVGGWVLLISRAPADPDLWGHVRFGRDLVATGHLSRLDLFSFTSDRPWINHEWLSELLMASAFDRAGILGLNVLRLVVVGAVLGLLWHRSREVARAHRPVLLALGAIAITLRALPVRPQLFSLLCFAGLLAALAYAEDARTDKPLIVVPPIFAVWVNLHGGWIVGFGTLVLWTIACLIDRPRGRWWALPATTVGAALATLANPFGVGMWRFIASTVGPNRPAINDWLPLYAMPPAFWLGWLVAAGLCLAALRHRERVPLAHLCVVITLGLAAIKVSRLDAFFGLAAVFLLVRVFPTSERRRASAEAGSRAFQVTAAVSVIAIAIVATSHLRHLEIRPEMMPEPASVDFVIDHHLHGRFLTWFDWGQFAIWHLADHSVRISMDGRRETVYSDAVVNEHLRFYDGIDQNYARRIHADYAWLPLGLPAVKALQAEGWKLAFQGPVSVILTAPQTAAIPELVVSWTPSRDFPGP
jgi:hypothetical protein